MVGLLSTDTALDSKLGRCRQLVSELKEERDGSWLPHWRELGDYFLPVRGSFLGDAVTDTNKGDKRNSKIIDSTGTSAAETMSSGLMSTASDPARPWFRLTTLTPTLAESAGVKQYLEDVATAISDMLLKSNFYDCVADGYTDLGVFGTTAIMAEEDDADVMRFRTFPIGSYFLACSSRGVVDTFAREFAMTVRQIVQEYGEENLSDQVKEAYQRKRFNQKVSVVHIIAPNDLYDQDRGEIDAKYKAWSSCVFESASTDKFLKESGYNEFPVLCPRWSTKGEDVYGRSPGMKVLGSVKALQLEHREKARAIQWKVKPALVGPSTLENKRVSQVPGDITYTDERDGFKGLRPLHEVNLELEPLLADIQDLRREINRAFYVDLFRAFTSSVDRIKTAEEVRAIKAELLLLLGPAGLRLGGELFKPLIDRAFAVLNRRGRLPKPPPELEGQSLTVEFISVLAQAQKAAGVSSIATWFGMLGQWAALDPSILDKADIDQAADVVGDMLGVPSSIIRPDDKVDGIRQARAQQQAAAAKAALAEQASKAAKNLSETDVSGDNGLTRVLRGPGFNQQAV
jgi:hypothetical protein